MPDRLNRALAVMVCALLLAAPGGLDLTPLHVMASSSEYPEPSYLVVIAYNDWAGLQHLATLGLDVLDLQFRVPNLLGDGVLAAVVTPQELATLRSPGFAVRILDSPATLGQYYLVTLPPEPETSHALSQSPERSEGAANWRKSGITSATAWRCWGWTKFRNTLSALVGRHNTITLFCPLI